MEPDRAHECCGECQPGCCYIDERNGEQFTGRGVEMGEEPRQDVPPPLDDLLITAWGVIANAGQGDWERETEEWQQAARKWRDNYHAYLASSPKSMGPFDLISGTPLSGGDFVLRLSTEQVSMLAWALIRYADWLPSEGWNVGPCRDLAYAFAALSGDH